MAGLLDSISGFFSGPADPEAIDPRYGITQQQLYDAKMQSLGSAGLTLLAAGQRMQPEQRAQILAGLGNIPGQYQQGISQAMQQRLLASQIGTAQSKATTLAGIQKEMENPAAFETKYGFSPAGMDASIAQEILQRGTLARVEAAAKPPTFFERDLNDVIERVRADTGEVVSTRQKGIAPGTAQANALAQARLDQGRGGGGKIQANDQGLLFNVGDDGTATPVMLPDGTQMRSAPAASAKPTEGQNQAAGWLLQATTAYKNITDVLRENPDAANPGIVSSTVKAALGDTAANYIRSPAQQRFAQAAASFAEAALRAATGAGVNESEADQKVRELTPQLGEGAEVIAQKMAGMQMYLESLRLRAGPAAANVPSLFETPGAPPPAAGAPAPAGGSSAEDLKKKYNLD
jgi:hypothetical protein